MLLIDLSDLAGCCQLHQLLREPTVSPARFAGRLSQSCGSILFERCFHGRHEGSPVALQGVQVGAEGSLKCCEDPVARLRGVSGPPPVRAAQEVEERQELPRMLRAQVIDQGPGLGVQVALIPAAEAGVSDQTLQRESDLEFVASRGAAGRGRG